MDSDGSHLMSIEHPGSGHDNSMLSLIITPGEIAPLVGTAPRDDDRVEFACNLPGHYASGMSGAIQIEG